MNQIPKEWCINCGDPIDPTDERWELRKVCDEDEGIWEHWHDEHWWPAMPHPRDCEGGGPVTKSRFEVVEAFNGYVLYDNITNRSRSMGDGTDRPYGEIATPEFLAEWQRDVDENEEEYLEAYFYQPIVSEVDGFRIERRAHAFGTNLVDQAQPVIKVSKGAWSTLMTGTTILCLSGQFVSALKATDEEIVDSIVCDESTY